MSDVPTSTTDDPDHVAVLRERAEALPGTQAERDILAFENALLRGPQIDISTRQGKAWADTYEGDWSDTEAMRTDFTSMFPSTEASPVGEGAETTTPPETAETDFGTGMTEDLRRNQTGVAHPPGTSTEPEPDAIQKALDTQEQYTKAGAPPLAAREAGIGSMLESAAAGAPELAWNDEEREAWKEKFPW